jgi:hypothetical protein
MMTFRTVSLVALLLWDIFYLYWVLFGHYKNTFLYPDRFERIDAKMWREHAFLLE